MNFEHYYKYARLSDCIPTEVIEDIYEDLPKWVNHDSIYNLNLHYVDDEYLNNIPLEVFDRKFHAVQKFIHNANLTPHGGLSLAESVCMLKHILIFRVLKILPLFSD